MKTMDSDFPLVSVIVPVYNASQYLRQTLDCICEQTLSDIEIIIVDDGSTDDSPSILREYASRDARITLLWQEHEYAGAARHKGMAIANGKYLSFLDADDIFEPDMLEKMVHRAEAVDAQVVMCRSEIFHEEKVYKPLSWALKDAYLPGVDLNCFNFLTENSYLAFQTLLGWPWDKLFLRSYVEKRGFSFGPTRHGNDGPFVFPAMFAAERISVVNESLVKYRQMGNQISSSNNLSKNPTAGCESVERIYSAMLQQQLSPGIWSSFYVWITTYLRWNMMMMDMEGKQVLKQYIQQHFEPKFNVVNNTTGKDIRKEFRADVDWYKSMVAPAISVVVPVYNASLYLEKALDSLLKQTFPDFEAICVNDGSTDNSLEILKKYASLDARFSIIDVPNGGYGCAMNLGMKAAKGKYFAILEPDDYLPLVAYEKLHRVAEENKLDIARGKRISFYNDNKNCEIHKEYANFPNANQIIRPRSHRRLFYHGAPEIWCGLYRLDFLRSHGIDFHESPGAAYQDTGFFMQTFGYAERVMFINEVVYMYRTDNSASSINNLAGKLPVIQREFAFIRHKLQQHENSWNEIKELYLLRRIVVHKWLQENVLPHMLKSFLEASREEFLQLVDISRMHLSVEDKENIEALMISVDYYLTNQLIERKCRQILTSLPQFPRDKHTNDVFPQNNVKWYGLPLLRVVYKPHKRTIYLLGGISLWSRTVRNGKIVYRIFGVRVKSKKIK